MQSKDQPEPYSFDAEGSKTSLRELRDLSLRPSRPELQKVVLDVTEYVIPRRSLMEKSRLSNFSSL